MENRNLTSYTYFLIGIAVTLFLVSCNVNPENTVATLPEKTTVDNTRSAAVPIEQIPVDEVPETAPTPSRSHLIKTTPSKDEEQSDHVTYEISPEKIDSLNKIIPLYDTTKYNRMAISYFTTLADGLHGRPFFANDADSLLNVIIEILSTRINDGTDIVFLIDKTASMNDDIDKVQNSMELILDYLKKFDNVKVGLAEYGDKNWHYDLWYNRLDLSNDIDGMKDFLKEYKTIGNPDVPESVNDAIVKTVTEMNWTDGNKRLLLVIGDAPSQAPPLSDYSLQQVIDKCAALKVTFNLYPIILGASPFQQYDTFVKKNFSKTYPNPVDQMLNVVLDEDGTFMYRLNDMTGRVVKEGVFNSRGGIINFNDIQNGNYLIQIFDQTGEKFNSKLIVVQHK